MGEGRSKCCKVITNCRNEQVVQQSVMFEITWESARDFMSKLINKIFRIVTLPLFLTLLSCSVTSVDEKEAKKFAETFIINLNKTDMSALETLMHPKAWKKMATQSESIQQYLSDTSKMGTPKIHLNKLVTKRKYEDDSGISFIFTYRIVAIYDEWLGDWEVVVVQLDRKNFLSKFIAHKMRSKPDDFDVSKFKVQ